MINVGIWSSLLPKLSHNEYVRRKTHVEMINKSTYVGLYQHNQTLVLQYNTKITTNTVKSLQHNFFNRVQIFRPTYEEGQKNK